MDTILSLTTPPDVAFARVLTTAAEALAQSRGLGKRESMRFQLAVEEFFTYLAQVAHEDCAIQTVLTGKPYQVCASLQFQASGLCLGALNASCTTSLDGAGEAANDLGLILAGRVADRFRLTRDGESSFTLHAEVDKAYPAAKAPPSTVTFKPPYRAGLEHDPNRLMHAAALAAARYPAWHCPASFQTPGKFADLVRAGQFTCVLALDEASHPAGLLCWARSGEKGLSFSGPFVFAPQEDAPQVARMLADAFLATVAREKIEIVFSERATQDTPDGYFETLGTLTRYDEAGQSEQPVLYRHLREDMGETVWADPALEGFLRGVYDRLAMCRDVLAAQPFGASGPSERKSSLFSTTMDKGKGLAVLRPLLDGEDMAANLAGHVRVLSDKGFLNILLYMDLSQAWEASLAGPVMDAGFKPRLVLPFAGRSDVAVFQYAPAR
ncbi:ATP-binding protein [Fundidesulfovibrio putealis]|uniref:ATP-binding protein n=1 Tax=Fundidesulfovibrio putealis TaxID=270496 RepID=UPI00040C1B2B|nr:ATP-binding protein [Fundidesulfovibrio putealis]